MMISYSFREKAESFLTNRYFIIETIIITCFLMGWIAGPGFALGLTIVLLTFWATKWDWDFFGLGNVNWKIGLKEALGYTMMIILLNDILVEPVTEIATGPPLSQNTFEMIPGDSMGLVYVVIYIWIVIAFGEEIFFRGYLMNRLAILLGNRTAAWVTAAAASSIIFGLAHAYLGLAGIITNGFVGLILAIAFYRNRDNLLVGILTHGLYETFRLILIYLSKEDAIKNWMMETIKQL